MAATTTPILELSGACKSFGEGARRNEILAGVDLKIAEGEFVAIVGYSGSGKTTLISLMAGLEQPDSGALLLRDREVTGPGPERGVVFQSYSLIPWLTVTGNIALAVDAAHRGKSKADRRVLVRRYIDMVGLGHAAERRPAELSGGMRQRVAVARALAMQPEILLLDDPLSALDALTRAKLQDELAQISAIEKKTIVLITNDVDAAILLADRVLPLNPGPRASLGKEFRVDIPRPRDRAALNADDGFITLRRAITEYLLAANAGRPNAAERTIVLPNVVPITQAR